MVDQAMSIFEFLDKFLIFGHPLTPLGDGCASALFADNQSENEIDWSKSSQCGFQNVLWDL